MLLPWLNVLAVNGYERVSIFSTLFMPQTGCVSNLVDRRTSETTTTEVNDLSATSTPDERRTTVTWHKLNEIWELPGIGSIAQGEVESGVLLPVHNRGIHGRYLGRWQIRVNDERDNTIWPSELATRNDHGSFWLCLSNSRGSFEPSNVSRINQLGEPVNCLDRVEEDITLKDCPTKPCSIAGPPSAAVRGSAVS